MIERRHMLDLAHLPERGANRIAEQAYAAVRAGEDGKLWTPHSDPITAAIEHEAIMHGAAIVRSVYVSMADKLGLDQAPDFARWEEDGHELLVKARSLGFLDRLKGVSGISELLDLVDKVFAAFAPEAKETQAAKDRIIRAYLAGGQRDTITDPRDIARYPVNLSVAGKQFRLNADRLNQVRYMQALGAENVRDWGTDARSKLKRMLIHGQQQAWPSAKLQSELFDTFGDMNRDWRRLAVTESNEAAVQGFVAGQKPGTKLKRVERAGACSFCERINGEVVTVVEPTGDVTERDPPVIWVGKSNVGRSASPNQRVNGELVPRGASELWWIAAGVQHPLCRGSYISVNVPKGEK